MLRYPWRNLTAHSLLPFWPLIVTAVIYLTVAGFYLSSAHGNFTFFVHLADGPVTRYFGGAPAGLWITGGGHDGSSYYAIAREPFNIPALNNMLTFPHLRYRRILFPLLVHLLSLGNPGLIAPMMLLINLLAILLGGYVLQRLIAPYGLGPGWTLLYTFHPGVLLSFLYDLPTALALLGVMLGLLWYHRGWQLGTAFSFSASLFTWEVVTYPILLGWLGYEGLRRLRRREGRRPFFWVLILPLALGLVWEVVLKWLFPAEMSTRVLGNLGYAGAGWWSVVHYWLATPWDLQKIFPVAFGVFVAIGILVAVARFFTSGSLIATLGLAQALLVLHLVPSNIVWPIEITRKSLGLWLFTFLGFAVHRDRASWVILFGTLGATLFLWFWLP